MLKFLRLGNESAFLESTWVRRLGRRLLGHIGIGFAVKLWALDGMLSVLPHKPCRVLDVGCDDGMYDFHMLRRWPNIVIDGIDGSEEAICRAKKTAEMKNLDNIKFFKISFEEYQPERKYDLVLCLDSIYYSIDGMSFLRYACQSLVDDGYIVFSSPRLKRHYGGSFGYYTGHVDIEHLDQVFTKDNVIKVMQEEGLHVLTCKNYPSFFARALLEVQRSHSSFTRCLYPLFIIAAWFGRNGSESNASHYMIMARFNVHE